jgi:hypothetical protein
LTVVLAVVLVAAATTVVALGLFGGKSTPHQLTAGDRSSRSQSSAASAVTCPNRLSVVVTASYAPVLRQVAPSLVTGANCADLQIAVADGSGAAAKVASTDADLWIPDDESWPQLPNTDDLATSALAADGSTNQANVIATSPMYLVTLRSGAALPATDHSLAKLGEQFGQPNGWTLTTPDPTATGAGMVGVGAIATAVGNADGPLVSALDMMRAWQHSSTTTATAAALPTRSSQVALVPEYALLTVSNLSNYTITAPTDGPVILRYSWFPTKAAMTNPTQAAELARLRAALTGADGRKAVAAAGLRTASWPAPPPPSAAEAGLPSVSGTPDPLLSEHWMYHVLSTWDPALRKANVLIVLDVSGSMADPAPGTDTSKISLVQQGLNQAVALWPDSSRVGVWQFGSKLAPPNDWQSLVPIAGLTADQRTLITQATTSLRARPTGTALYSTILAGYQQLQANYETGIPNELLIFTDGIDQDDPTGISLSQLQNGLAATDPTKRVQLSIFGFGNAVPIDTLTTALEPVGGQVDQLASADEAIGAFVHAVSGGLSGNSG